MTPKVPPDSGRVEDLTYAFAPVHKLALGVAVGAVLGSVMFAVTAFHVVAHPAEAPPIELLVQYFYGYTVSWPGAVVAFLWGGMSGFVMGWFAALVRNLAVSIAVFVFRTKANLRQTADFLDHI